VSRVAIFNRSDSWRVANAGGRDSGRQKISSCPGGLVEVPYEALTPKRNETVNLLVPVCASFTHVAFSTFRLEPQYAVFGHASGTAAALAVKRFDLIVQDVNVTLLRETLVDQKQIISRNTTTTSPL